MTSAKNSLKTIYNKIRRLNLKIQVQLRFKNLYDTCKVRITMADNSKTYMCLSQSYSSTILNDLNKLCFYNLTKLSKVINCSNSITISCLGFLSQEQTVLL